MPTHPGTFNPGRSRARTDHQNATRKTAAQRGYNARWVKARKEHLAMSPLCVYCQQEGKTVAATVVDHVQPHRGDAILFWDNSNWQSLCLNCHNKKSAGENTQAVFASNRPGWVEPSVIPVTIVAGCYGVGKSKWVNERKTERTIVIDTADIMDELAGTTGHRAPKSVLNAAIAERNRRIGRLAKPVSQKFTHCYIVQALPDAKTRNWWVKKLSGHTSVSAVVLMADPDVCKERILASPHHPDYHTEYVDPWFRAYTRSFNELEIYHGEP